MKTVNRELSRSDVLPFRREERSLVKPIIGGEIGRCHKIGGQQRQIRLSGNCLCRVKRPQA